MVVGLKGQYRTQKIIAVLCVLGNFPVAIGFIFRSITDRMIDPILLVMGVVFYFLSIVAIILAGMQLAGKYNKWILWIVYSLFVLLLFESIFDVPLFQGTLFLWCSKMIGSSTLLLPGFHLYFQTRNDEKNTFVSSQAAS